MATSPPLIDLALVEEHNQDAQVVGETYLARQLIWPPEKATLSDAVELGK